MKFKLEKSTAKELLDFTIAFREIEAAKKVLRKYRYAVDRLWEIDDINFSIEKTDDPDRYANVTEAEKLAFLNDVLEAHTSAIDDAIADNITDLLPPTT